MTEARAAVPTGDTGLHVSLVPPAARAFQGLRAGVVTRVLAATIDFIVLVVVMVASYLGFSAASFLWNTRNFHFRSLSFTVVVIVGGVLLAVYFSICWARTGRTLGADVLGLRVVSRHGGRLSAGVAVARAVLCVLVPIGLFWASVNRKNRSVQDLVLRTSVLYDWPAAHLDGDLGVHPERVMPANPSVEDARATTRES